MKIPFDIKYRPQIESGEYKVETRDGRPARIICWDANQFYPICAQFRLCAGTLIARYFDCNGIFEGSGETENENDYDLFLVTPEPELSEFEKGLVDFYNKRSAMSPDKDGVFNKHDLDELLHKTAAELLELAKKELCESGEVTDWYAKGKAEALKDLPRWVKVNKGDLLDKYSNYLLCSNEGYYYCSGDTITRDGYMLLVDGLEKLPKEDEK